MSVTATTAPARSAVNKFATSQILIRATGLDMTIDVADNAGNARGSLILGVVAGAARKISFDASGDAIVDPGTGVAVAGIMGTILTTFATAGGSLANRFAAVDAVLQTNGILPS